VGAYGICIALIVECFAFVARMQRRKGHMKSIQLTLQNVLYAITYLMVDIYVMVSFLLALLFVLIGGLQLSLTMICVADLSLCSTIRLDLTPAVKLMIFGVICNTVASYHLIGAIQGTRARCTRCALTVFVHCALTVLSLCSHCIRTLCSHCVLTVLVHCTRTLCSHCALTELVHCAPTVLSLYSYTVLIHCTPTVLPLYSQGTWARFLGGLRHCCGNGLAHSAEDYDISGTGEAGTHTHDHDAGEVSIPLDSNEQQAWGDETKTHRTGDEGEEAPSSQAVVRTPGGKKREQMSRTVV
jgi:hypothetical protein